MKLDRKFTFALGAIVASVPLFLAAQTAAKPMTAKITGVTLWPASDIKWVPMPGLEGAMQAPLWGDPTKDAHGILYKWPAKTAVPQHTHTNGDRGVVVSGTLTLAVDGGPVKKFPPGSYFTMAGGTKHATGVDGDQPCVFFLEREGPFDVKMVEAGH